MPRGFCPGCNKTTDVCEVYIVRRWSKEKISGGFACRKCWNGGGDSYPVVYWP